MAKLSALSVDALDYITLKVQHRQCIGGCGLAPEDGDIFCSGCREGFERDRPADPDQGLDW